MKIGFIGYGSMAKALAAKWQGKHELFFSGRDTARAAEVAARFNGGSGSPADAAAFGQVVVLATRWNDVFDAIDLAGGAGAFAGKIVLDINNPVDTETFVTTREDGRSLTEAIAGALPDAHLGKAFNMAQARVWENPDMTFDGRPLVTLYTADADAAEPIAELIADTGSDPLLLGGNEHAYQLEAAAAIVIKFLLSGRLHDTVLNLIQPETKPVR